MNFTKGMGSRGTFRAVIGIAFLLLLPVLLEPFGADNAVLHSMALDWVRLGKIPYIGSWDNNFPGIIYIHALSILTFGPADLGYRLFDIVIELAFAGSFYRFLLRWLKPHTAALAAVLYIAYYVSGAQDVYGKQDAYGMMLVLVGTAFLLAPESGGIRKWPSVFAAGLISGTAFLMRPTFLLYTGLLFLYIGWLANRRISFRSTTNALLFLAASLIPAIAVVAYYSTIPGGVAALYDSVIRFNLDVYTKLGTTSKLSWELIRTGLLLPLAVYAAIRPKQVVQFLRRTLNSNENILYAAFLIGAIGIVLLMGKYYRYHLVPFFLLVVPLSAAGLEAAIGRVRLETRRHVAMLAAVFFCTFVAYNPKAPLAFGLGILTHKNPFAAADAARRPDTVFGAKTELALRNYLDLPKNRDGSVEVCSFEPFLRYHLELEGRPIAGPYITFHALAFRTDATRLGTPHYTPYQLAWQRAYMDTLRAAKPHFIILARNMPFWYIHDVYTDCLHYLPGFDSLLATSYRYDTTFGGFRVFRSR